MLHRAAMLCRAAMLDPCCAATDFGCLHGAPVLVGIGVMAEFVTIKEAAEHLDMSERTIARMVAAGSLTGYVDWDEVGSKLLPVRHRRQRAAGPRT